jgi:adenosylcobinamide kinase/adenosylcobinamide-phosphate guanylyltransferase
LEIRNMEDNKSAVCIEKHVNDKRGSISLLLGGARSGKSAFAERLASRFEKVAYVATAEAIDEEMKERIRNHREARPDTWRTYEVDGSMTGAAEDAFREADAVIVDCLTVYVGRRMEAEKTAGVDKIVDEIIEVAETAKISGKTAIFVSNEVGLGLVPEHPVGRHYRDLLGKVNQQVARIADHVYFVVAGIPIDVKAIGGLPGLDEIGR